MAGGMTGPGRSRRSLAERAGSPPTGTGGAAELSGSADRPAGDDGAGRPCWVSVAEGRLPLPGTVHAWRRAADGSWEGLVVAWLPSAAVRPRA